MKNHFIKFENYSDQIMGSDGKPTWEDIDKYNSKYGLSKPWVLTYKKAKPEIGLGIMYSSDMVDDPEDSTLYFSCTGYQELSIITHGDNSIYLEYSYDGHDFKRWKYTGENLPFGSEMGHKYLYIKGYNPNGLNPNFYKETSPEIYEETYSSFSFLPIEEDENFDMFNPVNGVYVGGNLHALIGTNDSNTVPCDYCFYGLFENCEMLCGNSNLILPYTILTRSCYENMFKGCSLLYGESGVVELPAAELAPYCYKSMFENCSILQYPPELPATTLSEGCYTSMFSGCKKLKLHNGYTLPASELAPYCYNGMFMMCYSLDKTPNLTTISTLADHCCQSMFEDCGGITEVDLRYTYRPEGEDKWDPVELVDGCYKDMFSGCMNLSKVYIYTNTRPVVKQNTNGFDYPYTDGWLRGVNANGTLVELIPYGYQAIDWGNNLPNNWNIQIIR